MMHPRERTAPRPLGRGETLPAPAWREASPQGLRRARDRGGWVTAVLIAVALTLIVRWVLVEPFQIPTSSMEPALKPGDHIFVNKAVYGLRVPFVNQRILRGREPQRGELVVFRSVEDREHAVIVKRVVGLPGERVRIDGGDVFIDGELLTEPWSVAGVTYTRPRTPFQTDMRYGVRDESRFSVVPEDHYFLLGDNSAFSRDGRHYGWAPNENILGRVSVVWWPISRWTDFTGFTAAWWWRALLGGVAVLVAARALWGRSLTTSSRSQGAALGPNDHILVATWPFGLRLPFTSLRLFPGREPRRGELVVYRHPGDGTAGGRRGELMVGRVVARGGERVAIATGKVSVDGQPVPGVEAYGAGSADDNAVGEYATAVTNGRAARRYFILHDGSPDQEDSRTFGWVDHGGLVGTVRVVWWPFKRRRRVT